MNKKTIALGIDDFKRIIEGNHYLVDKSLFIKEAVSDGAGVTLLPRPRRWGKTLNMSMLKYFFQKTENSYRHLFHGLAIEQFPEIMEHQGKYPVIFLTFKDAKDLHWTECCKVLQSIIAQEYKNHEYLLEGFLLDENEKKEYHLIMNKADDISLFKLSLHALCRYLHKHHGVEPIILIDEYDAPIIAGFENGYYQEVVNFMQTFLGMAFKGNLHLKKGFLTGILRISKESIFSGLNNVSVCTLVDQQYSQYFGFSEDEVTAMLAYYGPHENDSQIRHWYNNYQMGSMHSVYNPWSIISYIKKERRLISHWINSANNNLIKKILQNSPKSVKSDLELLLQGKIIEKELVDFVTFNNIFTHPDVAFTFLLFTGYLSFERVYLNEKSGREHASLIIPNREVRFFHEDAITSWIEESLEMSNYQNMLKDLIDGNIESFKEVFEYTVERVLSSFDTADNEPEKFYHMFVLGMLVCLQETHQVLSNRQSGTGRYDVMIIPKDITKIGIIIEFKKSMTQESLEAAKENALTQILKKGYKAELEARGITQIINIAIAFAGKKVLVKYQDPVFCLA